jgi:1-acyl-sn-glycerol-3-phosphate acyltransferase
VVTDICRRVVIVILLRAILFNIGFTIWTIVLGIVCLPLLLANWRWSARLGGFWVRTVFFWLRLSVGLTYEVRGREHLPDGKMIVAVKHQSAWDTLMLNELLTLPAIVYKRELNFLPLIGWYVWRARMIPVDRHGRSAALRRMLNAARQALSDGRAVVIFPEGTRGPVGGRLPYQPGVSALYSQLKVPLVPVALNSGLFWSRKAFTKRPGRIIVEILPPIEAGLPRRQMMVMLEQRIEAATDRLIAEAQGNARLKTKQEQGRRSMVS